MPTRHVMYVPRAEIAYMRKGLLRLGLGSYQEYLGSAQWALTRRRLGMKRCEACGSHARGLVLHHMTYRNLGAESMQDVCTLCRGCHRRAHANARRTESLWVIEVSQRRQGMEPQEKVIEALRIACPLCHATPGSGCRTLNDRALGTEHKVRRQKASEEQREIGARKRRRRAKKSARSRRLTETHAQVIDQARVAEFPLDALRSELERSMDISLRIDS